MTTLIKTCGVCMITLPVTAFYKIENRPMCRCMDCHRQKVREYYERTRPADKPRAKRFDPTKPKPCFTCKAILAPEKFYKCGGKLSAYCKMCASQRARALYREKRLTAVAS